MNVLRSIINVEKLAHKGEMKYVVILFVVWNAIVANAKKTRIIIWEYYIDFYLRPRSSMTGPVRPSVRVSVRPSVTPFSLCSHHHIIMKFSGVIAMDWSDVHIKGQGQSSKVKVTEVKTQLSGFRAVTPVWMHIGQWNNAHNLKSHRKSALFFFKAVR